MTLNNPLANIMSKLLNADKVGKTSVQAGPVSKLTRKVLQKLKELGYIGDFKEISESGLEFFEVQLLGKLNQCGVISPNFNVKRTEFEKYEKRFLPAKGFGVLIVTTIKGIMTHAEAKEQNLGGKLIGYCY
jgi:small subunit ribosomal protein S8